MLSFLRYNYTEKYRVSLFENVFTIQYLKVNFESYTKMYQNPL